MGYSAAFLDFCSTIKYRLTSLRKQILYILWCSEKPLKAYDILQQLLQSQANAKPPTVYRVLDYFVALGCVHKIESIQSYALCHEPEKKYHCELLMVCGQCHAVTEVYDPEVHTLVEQLSIKHQFVLNPGVIEIKGQCQSCHA